VRRRHDEILRRRTARLRAADAVPAVTYDPAVQCLYERNGTGSRRAAAVSLIDFALPGYIYPGGVVVPLFVPVQVVLPCGQLLVAAPLGAVVPVLFGAPGVVVPDPVLPGVPGVLVLPGVPGTVLEVGVGVTVEPGVVV